MLGTVPEPDRAFSTLAVAVARVAAILALVVGVAAPAFAQLGGSHSLGDTGVGNGSQPGPGVYAAFFYIHYAADEIRSARP